MATTRPQSLAGNPSPAQSRCRPKSPEVNIRLACVSLKKELRPLLSPNCCFLTAFPLFLHSFVRLRSVITESCSRASTVARLRSQNGLSEKWLILCQESHEWFCFSGDPAPYLLKPGQESPLGTLLCPHLREACCSAPGPWPLSSISYCWPEPGQASVKGSKASGQLPCLFCACVHVKWLQLCPILWDSMDCSLPVSSVHGILQAIMLEWLAWHAMVHRVAKYQTRLKRLSTHACTIRVYCIL